MINPAIVQPSQQIKKTTKIRPPTSLQFHDSRPLPHPTYLLFMCSKKRNRNLIVMNIQNDEWKNPAMFCHRVNNVNKKCEQLWTNDMKVVWNMLKNESHRIEIKHILQKKIWCFRLLLGLALLVCAMYLLWWGLGTQNLGTQG